VNAFVLAGGQSTRMGRDKALLEFDGRPLIQNALERLRELGFDRRICGSRPDLQRFAPVVADNVPGCGPLGGIEAALAASDSELNLFVPVDTPLLPGVFLRWLMARAETSGAVATVPVSAGRPEPLCAVYSHRIAEGLRQSLQAGEHKVMTAIEHAAAALGERVDRFAMESVLAALPPGVWPAEPPLWEWFCNVNTPADFAELGAGVHPRLEPERLIQ
jgi:molybdopterin-guanine dinucleotide biosynthesis protein A